MKLSKKVFYFSIFSSLFALIFVVRLLILVKDYFSWKQQANELIVYNKTVVNDLSWAQWKPPINPEQYILLWLFSIDNNCKSQLPVSVECAEGIKSAIVEVECDPEKVNLITKSCAKPPFGKVLIKEIQDLSENKSKIVLTWYWSSELQVNESMPAMESFILLALDTIIISEKDWLIKINNKWISSNSEKKHENIEVVKVTKSSVLVEVLTPIGKKAIELRCGTVIKVNYL